MRKWRQSLLIIVAVAILAVSGSTWLKRGALAAAGQMYLSPASASVAKGGNFTVGIYINPSGNVDTVSVKMGFDANNVTYVGTSYAGSPFGTQIGFTASTSSISFSAADLGSSVTTTSLIANVTFTAKASAASTSMNLNGSNAAYSGAATNPSLAGSTISFVCPSGQTGTPPNCATPTPPPSGGGTGGGGGTSGGTSGGTKTSPVSGGTKSTPAAGSGVGSTSTGASQPVGTPPTSTDKKVQFTQAVLNFTTKDPTKAYIRYGLGDQLTATTPESDFATSHSIALDPTLIIPGQKYAYVIVTTNQQGAVSQSGVQTFTTKGLEVTVGVFDSNHKPVRNKTVTLHSTPQTVKTDGNGFATFKDVAPGSHSVIYTAGKKSYTQPVTVVNNVQTSGDTQTAPAQTFSVVYGFTQTDSHLGLWIWLAVVVLVVAALVVLGQAGRLGFALQFRPNTAAPLISQPVVIGGNVRPNQPNPTEPPSVPPVPADDRLNAIPDPSRPQPGMTITPKETDSKDTEP